MNEKHQAREIPIKKKALNKVIKKSAKLVRNGALGIRAEDEFSYSGFKVKVIIETKVIREYELAKEMSKNDE